MDNTTRSDLLAKLQSFEAACKEALLADAHRAAYNIWIQISNSCEEIRTRLGSATISQATYTLTRMGEGGPPEHNLLFIDLDCILNLTTAERIRIVDMMKLDETVMLRHGRWCIARTS